MSNTVKVTIFGEEYTIKTQETSKWVEDCAKIVDTKMKNISAEISVNSPHKIAILTALNLTAELMNLKNQYGKLFDSINDELGDLCKKLES
ncbi:MAG: cell division protein ZapA [Candidatus Delongbacteria bacterium]|nr:cell division protein ZapA [Candidatus Delongbacteria bacterium]MBN2834151.1 cell division protein ZapA [Candidatus Delongbacteria bacterium]